MTPDYKLIYSDILARKFPHKAEECKQLLAHDNLSLLHILELNDRIFGQTDKEAQSFNPKHKSYRKYDILQILEYQKEHNINNTQLARYFKLSRNTVAKWKKRFLT